MLRELQEKTRKVAPDDAWRVCYAVFSRSGFTDAARRLGGEIGADLIDLEDLERGMEA